MTAVDTTLMDKGYRKTPGAADMLMNFIVTTKQKTDWGSYTETWSYDRSDRGATRDTYTVGTMVLDVVDARSDSVVWTGSVSGMLEPTASEDFRTGRLNEAISGLLKDLPSRSE